jgi:hypothetical protein
MSRASAGIYNDKIIFSIPGSLSAVKLAIGQDNTQRNRPSSL